MNGLSRGILFRYAWRGLWQRRACLLYVLFLPVVAWLLPRLTPWEENPPVLAPARVQAVCFYLWGGLLAFFPFQAAVLGRRLHTEGLLEHWRAGGRKPWRLALELAAAVWLWVVAATSAGMLICALFCAPAQPVEAGLWRLLVIQQGGLLLLVSGPLILLAGAVGAAVSELAGTLVAASLVALGLFGIDWLQPLLAPGARGGPLSWLWVALPHYDLADLTSRFLFKLGPLPGAVFAGSAVALGLQGLALVLVSLCLFRAKS